MKPTTSRAGSVNFALVAIVVVISMVAATAAYLLGVYTTPSSTDSHPTSVASLSSPRTPAFEVIINKPSGPPRVFTGLNDGQGIPVTVSCSTCHATRSPNFENRTEKDLNEFHVNIKVAHGNTSCLSCHHSENYDLLKLADNTPVEYSEVMTLCAQCHGPQMRDFEHGAHGGMNGYWDRTRGPQMKNNCVDCHNPHRPQFPRMNPTFKPKDRFLEPAQQQH